MDTYLKTVERFDRREVAEDYVHKKNVADTFKNRRELACIAAALENIPGPGIILDIPSGTGRLLPLLLNLGHEVVQADASEHMLDAAKRYYSRGSNALSKEQLARVRFTCREVMDTGFSDNEFSAVICNRLFHHYPEAEVRRAVLAELARICNGPLIVSFFSNFAISAMRFHMANFFRGRKPSDRIPIWFREFQRDFVSCGLVCTEIYPVLFGISPQTYLKLTKGGDGGIKPDKTGTISID